ncbi:hypothetical protein TPB0596_12100 [Tsukamurella pulmonis]|uniref:hypothetical protein n=1 Tax=Tsukamurella pulmonis TaxID=47312 RepID=UPI001EDDC6F2|nr:hypothetical protein [Tsukamurella pulmonis]BDD81447.1 hypothetical protein TPB0596_12100 [Tsukamurella pulmonis]
MTVTTADALEAMNAVIACHSRTAPRWHDDPDAARFTATVWAEGFNHHALTLPDVIAGIKKRAFESPDTAPELPEIIQFARAVRRDRTEREDAETRRTRENAQDARLAALGINPDVRKAIAPAVTTLGNLNRPPTRPGNTRRGAGDAEARARARAELAGREPAPTPSAAPSDGPASPGTA